MDKLLLFRPRVSASCGCASCPSGRGAKGPRSWRLSPLSAVCRREDWGLAGLHRTGQWQLSAMTWFHELADSPAMHPHCKILSLPTSLPEKHYFCLGVNGTELNLQREVQTQSCALGASNIRTTDMVKVFQGKGPDQKVGLSGALTERRGSGSPCMFLSSVHMPAKMLTWRAGGESGVQADPALPKDLL